MSRCLHSHQSFAARVAWGLCATLACTGVAAAADFCTFPADPAFNGGVAIGDDFGNPNSNITPRQLARASNGDVVVAGLVPATGQGGGSNIGLARYTAGGQRAYWSGNPYVVYPNTTSANYYDIADMKIAFGRIYLLVTDGTDVRLVVFNENGTFSGDAPAFVSSSDERGVGLLPYAYTYYDSKGMLRTAYRVIAVAAVYDGTNRFTDVARFYGTGSYSVDTTFGPWGTGYTIAAYVQPMAMAAVATNTSAPRVYIAATNAVVAVDGGTGALVGGFGPGGVYYSSAANDIAVTSSGDAASDVLYLLGSQSYSPAVRKLVRNAGSDPSPDYSWGPGGGGVAPLPGPGPGPGTQVLGHAMTLDGQRVVVAGSTGTSGYPWIGSVVLATGQVEGTQGVSSLDWMHPWVDVMPGSTATSYLVIGGHGSPSHFGATQLLVSCDGVFRNGFE